MVCFLFLLFAPVLLIIGIAIYLIFFIPIFIIALIKERKRFKRMYEWD